MAGIGVVLLVIVALRRRALMLNEVPSPALSRAPDSSLPISVERVECLRRLIAAVYRDPRVTQGRWTEFP